MKVKKLIEDLRQMNPEADVIMCSGHSFKNVFFADPLRSGKVLLKTEDNNIGTQIDRLFCNAIADPTTNEIEFYKDLFERGINIELIRRYKGEKAAKWLEEKYERLGFAIPQSCNECYECNTKGDEVEI